MSKGSNSGCYTYPYCRRHHCQVLAPSISVDERLAYSCCHVLASGLVVLPCCLLAVRRAIVHKLALRANSQFGLDAAAVVTHIQVLHVKREASGKDQQLNHSYKSKCTNKSHNDPMNTTFSVSWCHTSVQHCARHSSKVLATAHRIQCDFDTIVVFQCAQCRLEVQVDAIQQLGPRVCCALAGSLRASHQRCVRASTYKTDTVIVCAVKRYGQCSLQRARFVCHASRQGVNSVRTARKSRDDDRTLQSCNHQLHVRSTLHHSAACKHPLRAPTRLQRSPSVWEQSNANRSIQLSRVCPSQARLLTALQRLWSHKATAVHGVVSLPFQGLCCMRRKLAQLYSIEAVPQLNCYL